MGRAVAHNGLRPLHLGPLDYLAKACCSVPHLPVSHLFHSIYQPDHDRVFITKIKNIPEAPPAPQQKNQRFFASFCVTPKPQKRKNYLKEQEKRKNFFL
jgi:hypothetical protein